MEIGASLWVKLNRDSEEWEKAILFEFDQNPGSDFRFGIRLQDEHYNILEPLKFIQSLPTLGSLTEFEHVKLRNILDDENPESVDDLTTLNHLHEPSINNCLRARFYQNKIYTNTGPILIAINPFSRLPIYDNEFVELYKTTGENQHTRSNTNVDPHVYQIADNAFRAMTFALRNGRSRVNQTILVSGESGAGKTETTKFILRYLADITRGTRHLLLHKAHGHRLEIESNNDKEESNPPSTTNKEEEEEKSLEDKVLQSNPILESFGNARTLRNDNSSRFGKFIELNFSHSAICGATIRTYLLEKCRLTQQAEGERNYHCFYELLAFSSSLSISSPSSISSSSPEHELKILRRGLTNKTSQSFFYTNQSSCFLRYDGVNDFNQFSSLLQAFETLKFSSIDQDSILDVIAGILHVGNIEFEISSSSSSITHNQSHQTQHENKNNNNNNIESAQFTNHSLEEHVGIFCELFGISRQEFLFSLSMKTIKTRNEIFTKPLSLEQVEINRDSFARNMYGSLFDWIVSRVNQSISFSSSSSSDQSHICSSSITTTLPTTTTTSSSSSLLIETPNYSASFSTPINSPSIKSSSFIGILDIFGFENFKLNSFEQLCINYTNEILQQHFNLFVFSHEQRLYQDEKIDWNSITFTDNEEILNLLNAKRGDSIFSMCDDLVKVQFAKSTSLYQKYYEKFHSHSRFTVSHSDKARNCFVIEHFAGPVKYDSTLFLEKNRDSISSQMAHLIRDSTVPLIQQMHSFLRLDLEDNSSSSSSSSFSPQSISSNPGSTSSFSSQSQPVSHRGRRGSEGMIAALSSNLDGVYKPGRRSSVTLGDRNFTPNNSSSSTTPTTTSCSSAFSPVSSMSNMTLGSMFRKQLDELMEKINETSPHYVRCIKPNSRNVPGIFELKLVTNQLKYAGVLEAVRVSRAGFPNRYSLNEFVSRYHDMAFTFDKNFSIERNNLVDFEKRKIFSQLPLSSQAFLVVRTVSQMILLNPEYQHAFHQSPMFIIQNNNNNNNNNNHNHNNNQKKNIEFKAGIQRGTSLVFLRRLTFDTLERMRLFEIRSAAAVIIQSKYLTRQSSRHYQLFKQKMIRIQMLWKRKLFYRRVLSRVIVSSAIKIQSTFRMYLEQSRFVVILFAIIQIQSVFRGGLARKKIELIRQEYYDQLSRHQYAIIIQSFFRRILAIHKVNQLTLMKIANSRSIFDVVKDSSIPFSVIDIMMKTFGNNIINSISEIDQSTPLINAILANNHPMVEYLINQGADLSLPGPEGLLPLMVACQIDSQESVKLILQTGFNPNTTSPSIDGMTALFIAMKNQHLSIQKLLISYGATVGKERVSTAVLAAQKGTPNMMQSLIETGIDPNTKSIDGISLLIHSLTAGNLGVATQLLMNGASFLKEKDKFGRSVLSIAVTIPKSLNLVHYFIQHGVGVNILNEDGSTALVTAMKIGNLEAVKYLLQQEEVEFEATDKEGMTALMLACRSGYDEIVDLLLFSQSPSTIYPSSQPPLPPSFHMNQQQHQLQQSLPLPPPSVVGSTTTSSSISSSSSVSNTRISGRLRRGVDVNHQSDGGMTALMLAIDGRHVNIAKSLILHGANVSLKDDFGYPALSRAVCSAPFFLQVLVESGANVNEIVPSTGRTPLMLATQVGNLRSARILLNLGADPNVQDLHGWTALMFAASTIYEEKTLKSKKHISITPKKSKASSTSPSPSTPPPSTSVSALGRDESFFYLDTPIASSSSSSSSSRTTLLETKHTRSSASSSTSSATSSSSSSSLDNEIKNAINLQFVRLLIEKGAQLELVNKDGETAKTLAEKAGHVNLIYALTPQTTTPPVLCDLSGLCISS